MLTSAPSPCTLSVMDGSIPSTGSGTGSPTGDKQLEQPSPSEKAVPVKEGSRDSAV